MKRALSLFVAQGPFLFSAVEGGLGPHLHKRLAREIGQVADGKGEDIIANVMAWVQTVQLRAVQDLAALPHGHFCGAWCTLQYQHWGVHGEHWAASLRLREDRDIGWVATTAVPQWSRRLRAATAHLQTTVLRAGACVARDDDDRWRDAVQEPPGGDVLLLDLPRFHPAEARTHVSQSAAARSANPGGRGLPTLGDVATPDFGDPRFQVQGGGLRRMAAGCGPDSEPAGTTPGGADLDALVEQHHAEVVVAADGPDSRRGASQR